MSRRQEFQFLVTWFFVFAGGCGEDLGPGAVQRTKAQDATTLAGDGRWAAPIEGSCVIGGVEHSAGIVRPGGCGRCDPRRSADTWSPRENECFIEGRCMEAGTSSGPGCGQCDPEKAQLAWTVDGGFCQIGGLCHPAGALAPSGCGACDPAADTGAWTPLAGQCGIDGGCQPAGTESPEGCGVCNPAVSSTEWTVAPGYCFIAGSCRKAGTHSVDQCAQCDPASSAHGWTQNNNVCNIYGWCNAIGTPSPDGCGACDPSVSTVDWSPRKDKCRIGSDCFADGSLNPSHECAICDVETTPTAWTLLPGHCSIAGKCYDAGATSKECRVCDPDVDANTLQTAPGTCFIDGKCYVAGESGVGCDICDPDQASDKWSTQKNACETLTGCKPAGTAHPENPCLVCQDGPTGFDWNPVAAEKACGAPGATVGRCRGGRCMVRIPGGDYPHEAKDGWSEKSFTTATLMPYWIDMFEVTAGEVQDYLTALGGCSTNDCNDFTEPFAGDRDRPAVGVNRAFAEAWCAARGGRLPTDMEWERAAFGPPGPSHNAWRPTPWAAACEAPNACPVSCGYPGAAVTEGIWAEDGSHADQEPTYWGWPEYTMKAGLGTPAGASLEGVHGLIGNAGEWLDGEYLAGPYGGLGLVRGYGAREDGYKVTLGSKPEDVECPSDYYVESWTDLSSYLYDLIVSCHEFRIYDEFEFSNTARSGKRPYGSSPEVGFRCARDCTEPDCTDPAVVNDDGLACTTRVCSSVGCNDVPDPGWCVIRAECVPAGQQKPNEACRVCVPTADRFDWSSADNGADCPDGTCQSGACMVPIAGGPTWIGDVNAGPSATPEHEVWLPAFAIDRTEVSADDFAKFVSEKGNLCGADPCLRCEQAGSIACQADTYEASDTCRCMPGGTVVADCGVHPADQATRAGADAYCAARGARLPSEAEWERAAADSTVGWWLAGTVCGAATACAGSACDPAHEMTVPVWKVGKGDGAVLNLVGNAPEWVADGWSPNYIGTRADGAPRKFEGPLGVVRGSTQSAAGSAVGPSAAARIPMNAAGGAGFRCALSTEPPCADPCVDKDPCTDDRCSSGGCVHARRPGTCTTAFGCVEVGAVIDGECTSCVDSSAPTMETLGDGSSCGSGVCVDGLCIEIGEDELSIPGGGAAFGPSGIAAGAAPALVSVTVAPTLLDRREVTNAAFRDFLVPHGNDCGGTPCYSGGSSGQLDLESAEIRIKNACLGESCAAYPVVHVTFAGAQAYCDSIGKRLPSDAEWSLAASGSAESRRRFPWGDSWDGVCPWPLPLKDVCTCRADDWSPETARAHGGMVGLTSSAAGGSYPAGRSPEGADDLAGNVWEWVDDCAADCTQGQAVARGGGFLSDAMALAAESRQGIPPSTSREDLGFRCARDLPDVPVSP